MPVSMEVLFICFPIFQYISDATVLRYGPLALVAHPDLSMKGGVRKIDFLKNCIVHAF